MAWEVYVMTEEGHYKFWSLEKNDSNRYTGRTAHGRIGNTPVYSYADDIDGKLREKRRKGYRQFTLNSPRPDPESTERVDRFMERVHRQSGREQQSISVVSFTTPTPESQRQIVEEARNITVPEAMLAKEGSEDNLDRTDMIAEVKWDGSRVLLIKRGNVVRLFSRGHIEYTQSYPEVLEDARKLRADSCILDAEGVFFQGTTMNDHFLTIASRPESRTGLRFVLMTFDILEKNGRNLKQLPLMERKRILDDTIPDDLMHIKEIEFVSAATNKRAFYREQTQAGREGIMLKHIQSTYQEGARGNDWLKIKKMKTIDVIIRGATPGEGARTPFFGALKMYYPVNGRIEYIGNVGTGFDDDLLRQITAMLRTGREFVGEVRYREMTRDGKLRHVSFLRLRPDKSPAQVINGT